MMIIQVHDQKKAATQGDRFFLVLFLLAMFGGAIRKWVVESGLVGNLVLLVQMTMPFVMVALRPAGAKSPFNRFRILGIYFAYLVFQVFNPLQLTLFHGILGMMVHGLFWIGVFYYFSNRERFSPARYIPLMMVAVAIEISLAFVQYALPPDHVLNKYAHDAVKQVAVIGDSVRVSGTFSYLSGFTAFLLFYPFFTWALIRLRYPDWVVLLAVVAGASAGFMTGSRSGMALYFAFTGAIVLDSYPVRVIGRLAGRLILPLAILIAISLLFKELPVSQKINKAYTNFWERVDQNRRTGEQSRRLVWDLGYFTNLDRFQFPITGVGTGATYQGANILFGTSYYVYAFGFVESEFVRIILEGGIIIVFLRVILATVLVFAISFKNRLLRLLLWLTLLYAAPIVFNVHNATFLMLGIMLIDNIIWRQQRAALPVSGSPEETKLQQPGVGVRRGYPQVR